MPRHWFSTRALSVAMMITNEASKCNWETMSLWCKSVYLMVNLQSLWVNGFISVHTHINMYSLCPQVHVHEGQQMWHLGGKSCLTQLMWWRWFTARSFAVPMVTTDINTFFLLSSQISLVKLTLKNCFFCPYYDFSNLINDYHLSKMFPFLLIVWTILKGVIFFQIWLKQSHKQSRMLWLILWQNWAKIG